MKIGKVERYLNELMAKGTLLFPLIDPVDYASPELAVDVAVGTARGGAAAILVGGSIGVQGELLDNVVRRIKERVEQPIILFPGNIATMTAHADAIYFMSLLNSRNPYWISQAQALGAPVVRRLGLEPLPVGYIVVEPGGTVGWVGDARLVPRSEPKFAVALALAGEMMGARYILMDAGSASALGPIPTNMISAVKRAISVPLIIGGGITKPAEAKEIAKAGADAIQVGTIFQSAKSEKEAQIIAEKFVKAIQKIK